VERYLAEIRGSGVTLKLSKCRFALPEIKFCRQIVGSGKHNIDPSKVAALDAIKVPETKKSKSGSQADFRFFQFLS